LKVKRTQRDYNKYIDSCRNDLQNKKKKVFNNKKNLTSGNNGVISYISSIKNIEADNYKIITFYVNEGCPSCCEFVYNEIKNNRDFFENEQLYILASASNSTEAIAELSKYDLQDFSNLIIDSTNILKCLANPNELLNPRITVVKNNIVVLDTIYCSKDIVKEFTKHLYDISTDIFEDNIIIVE
jgi:hypothetical protein